MFSRSGQDLPQVLDLPVEKEITLFPPKLFSRPSARAFLVVLVHLPHVQTLLLVLFYQVRPEILAHPGTKRRILHDKDIRNYLTSMARVLSGGTYGLPGSSFLARIALLTTVSSAATRSSAALLSSLTLNIRLAAKSNVPPVRKHEETGCTLPLVLWLQGS